MEISLDTIIALLGLLFGGGALGGIFTWRWQRAKAKAEAKTAEIDAAKEMQDVYQQLIADVKQDRNEQKQYITELKQDREDIRLDRNRMQKRMAQLSDEIDMLKRIQSRQGRQIEALRPFLCADLKCKKRQLITIQDIATTNNESDTPDVDNSTIEEDETDDVNTM